MKGKNFLPRRILDAIGSAVRGPLTGKSVMTDTQPAGSWNAIVGSIAWLDSDSIFGKLTEAQREQVIRNHAVVYACYRKLTSAFLEADLMVGQDEDNVFQPDTEHPLNDLMANPNHKMSWDEFASVLVGNLSISGICYIWEWRNAAGFLEELWPIPKSWVRKIQSRDTGQTTGYVIMQGKKKVPVRLEDMTQLWFPDPSNPTQPLAPLQACMKDVQTDQERENYLAEMIHNLKFPSIILKQPEGWNEDQQKEARALIGDLIGKQGNARGGPLFLSGEGADATVLAPLKDLDWPGVANLSETRICSAFGVPPITVGVRAGVESSTYSNYEQADRAFYSQTMASLWRFVAAGLTRGLIVEEAAMLKDDTELYFKFDTSTVWQLQEDLGKATERATKAFLGGLIMRDEGRAMIGQDALGPPLGNIILQPLQLEAITVEIAGKALPAPKKPEPIIHTVTREEEHAAAS